MSTKINGVGGLSTDVLFKPSKLQGVGGESLEFIGFGVSEASSLSAVAYMKYFDGTSNIQIPIYDPADITMPSLRISTPWGIGAFNLVSLNDSLSSAIRISTSAGTMCIGLTG